MRTQAEASRDGMLPTEQRLQEEGDVYCKQLGIVFNCRQELGSMLVQLTGEGLLRH